MLTLAHFFLQVIYYTHTLIIILCLRFFFSFLYLVQVRYNQKNGKKLWELPKNSITFKTCIMHVTQQINAIFYY